MTVPVLPFEDPVGAFCRDNHMAALKGRDDGPLSGLTFGVKDVFHIARTRTGFGHPTWFATHEPPVETATAVKRLLDAGADLAGKTHTDELAYSLTGENVHYGTPNRPARVRHGASYNPLSERTVQNSYPVYARLREHSPGHRSVILGSWNISRYDDVLAVARDHERFSNDPRWRNATASVLPPAPDDYSILLVDPPEHTRLRKVAARAFTRPKQMELEPNSRAWRRAL